MKGNNGEHTTLCDADIHRASPAAREITAQHSRGGGAAQPRPDRRLEADQHRPVELRESRAQSARTVDSAPGVRCVALRSGVSARTIATLVGITGKKRALISSH